MCVNSSDFCAVRTVGVGLSTRVRIVWRRGKANINRLLGNAPTAHGPVCRLPYEIVEMIVAHIAHDLDSLKPFSLTCRSWYIAAVPHLHYTLTLTRRGKLEPLSELHRLDLTPLIRKLRVVQWHDKRFAPQAFSRLDLRYFTAFANVQTLSLKRLDISRCIPVIERYFGQFSPTLRSIALFEPFCTPRQLSHFFSLFPNLEDIEICGPPSPPNEIIPGAELIPFSTPKLRGRLVIYGYNSVETWTRLITVGGGLRFHYMELYRVGGCAPVLFEACTETLETLRFYATDVSAGEWFSTSIRVWANGEQESPFSSQISVYRGSKSSGLCKSEVGGVVSDHPTISWSRGYSRRSHPMPSPNSLSSLGPTR